MYLKLMFYKIIYIYIEAITEESATVPWRIFSLVNIIKVLALEFPTCSFGWVPRDANDVTYSLAKFLHLLYPLAFPVIAQISLPLCIRFGLEICLLVLRNNTFGLAKKKRDTS